MPIDNERFNRVRKVQAEMNELLYLLNSLGFNDLDECYEKIDVILVKMPEFAAVLKDFQRSEYYANSREFESYVTENFNPKDFRDDLDSMKNKIRHAAATLSRTERLRPSREEINVNVR